MNNFLIIAGTHRPAGIAHRVAEALMKLAEIHLTENNIDILPIDSLPFWDEGLWGEEAMALKWNQWNEMAKRLRAATGFIFISPEYGGMVPPRLMNFLLLCSGQELGHKPALAVGISAGRGGAYPITELRAYGYKNNHLCWLPDHLIIRNVEAIGLSELLDGQSSLNKTAAYSLRLLDQYARALTVVRASGVVDHEGFPYGM